MSRRRRGLPPGTERLPSGAYRIRLSIPNGDGTYRRPSVTVTGSVADVWDVFTGIDTERARGGTIDTTITVNEWRDRWLATRARTVGSPKTLETDTDRTAVFAAIHGQRPLRSITTDDIDTFYTHLSDVRGVSNQTVIGYHRVLRKWFNDAKRHIPYNPVIDATPPTVVRRSRSVWTPADVQRFLTAVTGDPMYPWWHLALHTGMRREELIAVEWRDIDGDVLTIQRRVVQTRTGVHVMDATKNGAAIRRVMLDPGTVGVLGRAAYEQRAAYLPIGVQWSDATRIVTKGDGVPYRPATVSQRWRRLVARVGTVPDIPLGRTRHTWGTIALANGIPQHVVAGRLGHSATVLMDRYAQPTSETDRRAAVVITEAMGGIA